METSKSKPRPAGTPMFGYATNSHNIYHREDPLTRMHTQMEFYARTAVAIALLMVALVAVATT